MNRFGRWVGGVLLVLCWAAPARAADELEKQLLKHAPDVLAALKESGYRNVGVLKFRIKKGSEPATDRAGTLNRRLAEKLELALILANRPRDPVGIVRDANRTAATIPGANHLTAEGRKKLFEKPYPLAWGAEEVVPDAFLTGVALIGEDRKRMTLGLMSFDRSGEELKQFAKFDVEMDLEDLFESGESFTVRGVFDQASLQMTDAERKEKASAEAIQTALTVKSETAKATKPAASKLHPLAPASDAPISLEIRYDGRAQPIEFREGGAFVPEPNETQKVTLVVRRKGAGKPRLGVVVKVNGQNTLFRQTLPDAQCNVWVFEPTLNEFALQGYQIDDGQLQLFKVLSQAESKAKEIDYGEFVGTISVSVFPEQVAEPVTPSTELLADDGEDFAILTRGTFPKETPKNLSALRNQLALSSTRGLIAEGATVDRKLEKTKFKRDSIPVMTATIKYYSPQDLPN